MRLKLILFLAFFFSLGISYTIYISSLEVYHCPKSVIELGYISRAKEEYLNDNLPLSDNKYKGDKVIFNEVKDLVSSFTDIRDFEAEDYSLSRVKLDIVPNYKKPLISRF